MAEWADILRPIRVRKVSTSGTKGVGLGIRAAGMLAWRQRSCEGRADEGVVVVVVVVLRRAGSEKGRRRGIIAGDVVDVF